MAKYHSRVSRVRKLMGNILMIITLNYSKKLRVGEKYETRRFYCNCNSDIFRL